MRLEVALSYRNGILLTGALEFRSRVPDIRIVSDMFNELFEILGEKIRERNLEEEEFAISFNAVETPYYGEEDTIEEERPCEEAKRARSPWRQQINVE